MILGVLSAHTQKIDIEAFLTIVRLVQRLIKTGPLAAMAVGTIAPPQSLEDDEELRAYV